MEANKYKLKPHIVYEDHLDMRSIKCACGKENCKIGLSFDSDPDIMRLTDKFGNEHAMHLNKINVTQLIKDLKLILKTIQE